MGKLKDRLRSMKKTVVWFSAFCVSTPIISTCYTFVSVTKYLWLFVLKLKHPKLDFVEANKIRNLLDTHRNQGIIHVLLHIQGQCNIEVVKETFLNNILERTNKDGAIKYQRLRQRFKKVWGYYGWITNESGFNINDHIIFGPSNHLGRPVTENNIQECVSGIVSKYMPDSLPQWQIILIPSIGDNMNSESYFMLVRMHHLILAEEDDLLLSDVLLVDTFPTTTPISLNETRLGDSTDPVDGFLGLDGCQNRRARNQQQIKYSSEPFGNFIPTLTHVPRLYRQVESVICNLWNELLSRYNGFGESNPGGLFDLAVLLFISSVTVVKDSCKTFSSVDDDAFVGLKCILSLCRREIVRRNISLKRIFNATFVSLNPQNIVQSGLNGIVWIGVTWCVLLPLFWYRELMAIIRFFLDPRPPRHNRSQVIEILLLEQPNAGYVITYSKLIYNATAELLHWLHLFVNIPRKVYEELFEKHKTISYALQSTSLCGRKVVSWSDKIEFSHVEKICKENGLTPNEIFFSAASSALQSFLEEFDMPIPANLEACARCIERDYIVGKTNYSDDVTGYILVNLPLEPYSTRQIEKLRRNFSKVEQDQVPLFLLYTAQKRYDILTKIMPKFCIQLLFNYLSKKFTVCVTQLDDGYNSEPSSEMASMLWKHKINDIIYFTPPQSNISVSLTIQRFGQHIRLAVMTDAVIRPFHNKLSQTWAKYIHEM